MEGGLEPITVDIGRGAGHRQHRTPFRHRADIER